MNISAEWLYEVKNRLVSDPNSLGPEEKRRYWKMVGHLKRQDQPDQTHIELMAEIRELLYVERFGDVKPTGPIIVLNTVAALGIIVSIFVMFSGSLLPGVILSLLSVAMFGFVYSWLWDFNKTAMILIFSSTVLFTIILDIIFISDEPLFLFLNSFFLIIVLPIMYLHGRLLGAKISGIKIEGVNIDVFGLPTLKLNYKSYLSAKPPMRQWVFFFGGIGTVLTSSIMAIFADLYFDNPYLYLIPVLLFIGELIDYTGKAGKLSGGEFNHLRREHRIIADWKKSLNGLGVV